MNPDHSDLLRDLTLSGTNNGEALFRALRMHRRRKARTRAATAATLALVAAALVFSRRPAAEAPPSSGSLAAVPPPGPGPMLTSEELLDSFGDQPVALVTWPDGRQQLLAIAHVAPQKAGR